MKIISTLFILLISSSTLFGQYWKRIDSVFSPSGIIVKSFSAPFFADLNGDLNYDLILGNLGNDADFYYNLGTTPLSFSLDTNILKTVYPPADFRTNGTYPCFVDIDGDNDSDLVIGGFNGLILYTNNGAVNPSWTKSTLLFDSINTKIGTDPKPSFTDIDADGDYDLFIGIGESFFEDGSIPGTTVAYRNIGTKLSPNFQLDNTLVVGLPDAGYNSYPTFADLDNDKDLDLLIGRDLTGLLYYKNLGNSQAPVWSLESTTFNVVEKSTYWKNPQLFDLDKDGDYDLIYGTDAGTLYYYENKGSVTSPSFVYNNLFPVVKAGGASSPSFADIDNDGDLDILSGSNIGPFEFFRNTGSKDKPIFVKSTAPFSGINPGSYSVPLFIDLDKDNDLDITSGALNGKLTSYINNNNVYSLTTSYFSTISAGWFSIPTFADINNDGEVDLFVGAEEAVNVKFYLNQGNFNMLQNDTLMASLNLPGRTKPVFVDLDNDNDYDLVCGNNWGEMFAYENTGTPSAPIWEDISELMEGIEVKQMASPGFADLDNDGKVDMVIGEYDGNFTYYKNLFAISSVKEDKNSEIPTEYVLSQNYPNPFNPATKINFSLKENSHVRLEVFNTLGEKIETLVDEYKNKGNYIVDFNGSKLNSGVYLYRITTGNFEKTMKMLLIK